MIITYNLTIHGHVYIDMNRNISHDLADFKQKSLFHYTKGRCIKLPCSRLHVVYIRAITGPFLLINHFFSYVRMSFHSVSSKRKHSFEAANVMYWYES